MKHKKNKLSSILGATVLASCITNCAKESESNHDSFPSQEVTDVQDSTILEITDKFTPFRFLPESTKQAINNSLTTDSNTEEDVNLVGTVTTSAPSEEEDVDMITDILSSNPYNLTFNLSAIGILNDTSLSINSFINTIPARHQTMIEQHYNRLESSIEESLAERNNNAHRILIENYEQNLLEFLEGYDFQLNLIKEDTSIPLTKIMQDFPFFEDSLRKYVQQIVTKESMWNPNATNGSTVGIAQITDDTWQDMMQNLNPPHETAYDNPKYDVVLNGRLTIRHFHRALTHLNSYSLFYQLLSELSEEDEMLGIYVLGQVHRMGMGHFNDFLTFISEDSEYSYSSLRAQYPELNPYYIFVIMVEEFADANDNARRVIDPMDITNITRKDMDLNIALHLRDEE